MKQPTRKPATPALPKYERRLILFLDFLGFKELVDRTVQEPNFLAELVSAMDIVGEIGQDDVELFKSQRITQFSDCIAVSYDVNEESAVFWLLADIAQSVVRLAEKGFLVRGGLTVGDLFHSERHVVGPAMVEAARLESKVAKFPRIIIDEQVLEVARRSKSDTHTRREEEKYVRAYMTKDADGLNYFDYVSWESVVNITGGENDFYGSYLFEIGNLVKAGLGNTDSGVQEKYLWLHTQYVAAIELIASLSPDNGYRLVNPDLCEAIESLPRHNDLAKTAARAVKRFKASRNQTP